MRVDVLALQRFYASPLGEVVRRAASRRLAALWPYTEGLDVLGLGYPTPYLERFRAGARRTVTMMPAAQGAEPWPADRVLTEHTQGVGNRFVDRLVAFRRQSRHPGVRLAAHPDRGRVGHGSSLRFCRQRRLHPSLSVAPRTVTERPTPVSLTAHGDGRGPIGTMPDARMVPHDAAAQQPPCLVRSAA